MTQQHPVVDRYLTRFEASINEFDFPEREEITQEIRNHIAEAQAAGTALDSVLQTLGPADVLARAYAVELALHPHAKRRGTRPGAVPKAIVARGMRGVRTLARLPIVLVAAGWGGVRAVVGRFLQALVAAGMRPVWALGRFVNALVAAGMRRVWAIGSFVKRVVAAGVRRVWALGAFLKALVATGTHRAWTLGGALKGAALVAAGSLAALIVGAMLAAIGIGFTLSGLYMLVVGTLEAAGLHMADAQINDMAPAVAMTLSPVLMVAGGAALLLLRLYLQFLVTALPRVFPATRGTALARAFSG